MSRVYESFHKRGAEILAIGPDELDDMVAFWKLKNIPFPGLPDPSCNVSRLFGQNQVWWKLGREPLTVMADGAGRIRFRKAGKGMWDTVSPKTMVDVLDQI